MASRTQRNAGLVQRKNINSSEFCDPDVQQQQQVDNRQIDEDELDHDSKETRLTLMEEVLLLGLKDREVTKPQFILLTSTFSLSPFL